jgi:tetratricopeptide (TPR) repeat protein
MCRLLKSRFTWGCLWIVTVVLVALGAYLTGRAVEGKVEDARTRNAPPSREEKLEREGRYDDAIRVIMENQDRLDEADVDWRVGWVYLERGKKDWANRQQWAQQAAVYFDKAAALASNDPFVLEQAMDGFNKVGDYSDKGCPDYEKAVHFGQAAIVLYQGNAVSPSGKVRRYPTQLVDDLQPQLARIQQKINAWCK